MMTYRPLTLTVALCAPLASSAHGGHAAPLAAHLHAIDLALLACIVAVALVAVTRSKS
jgi:branched-subunit amino acid transport protein